MTQLARRVTATLLFGLIVGCSLVAQDVEPAWLTIERADRYAAAGEFGRAIQLYREALQLQPGSAEALFGLGRAFVSAGDFPVAEQYLTEARSLAGNLRVPAAHFEILYELADLYQVQRRFSEREQILSNIITLAETEAPAGRTAAVQPDNLSEVLESDGIDRMLVLYRLAEDGATRARAEMCELLVSLGRYDAAVEHGIVGLLQELTTLIDALMARDPMYEYRSVRKSIADAELYPETRDYLSRTSLYRSLYFIAAGHFSAGRTDTALSLWRLVADLPGAGQIAVRARIQLEEPQAEPLIIPPE